MIRGMAHGARVFEQAHWLRSARRAADFIRANLWRDGRLLASYKDGQAHLNGYLDDYAFLLDALLELMQAEFRPADLAWARELADVLLDKFEDKAHGGFFFVSHDHEQLLHRAKIGARNDTPSGNSVAAFALDRLGHILGEPRYSEAARRTVQAFRPLLEEHPSSHGMLGTALDEQLAPPTLVVLTGDGGLSAWQRALDAQYPAARHFTRDTGRHGGSAGHARQTRRRRRESVGLPGRHLPAADHRFRRHAGRCQRARVNRAAMPAPAMPRYVCQVDLHRQDRSTNKPFQVEFHRRHRRAPPQEP